MSETKAAFVHRPKRSSKSSLCRYMQNNGYKYIHRLPELDTTLNSEKNCSIDLKSKDVKKSDFLSIPYNKPLRECRKPKVETGDRLRIS